MKLLRSGQYEPFKASWHGALMGLAAGAALYNLAALGLRRDRHLAVNASLYIAWTVFELHKTRGHCR